MTPGDSRAAKKDTAVKISALTVLLDRAGGRITFTEADYQAVITKYGGPSMLVIHSDVVRDGSRPIEIRLRLLSRAPKNGELVV